MKNAVIASLFLVPALLLTFFPAGCSGFSSDSEAALEAARVAILEEFNRVNIELRRAAERLGASGLTGCDARSALEDLYLAIPSAVDCAAVDSRGIMVTIEPASYRHHENKDISGQEQVKRMLDRREPVMTGIFLTVEGIEAGDAEYPVFGHEGAFLGSVSLLFSPEKLLDGALSPVSGKTDGLVVIETGGRILRHSDGARIGTNLFASAGFKSDERMRRLGERLAAELEGRDGPTGASWKSVELYNGFWRIVDLPSR